MKMLITALDGAILERDGTLFQALVFKESLERSDKTWQRWNGWSGKWPTYAIGSLPTEHLETEFRLQYEVVTMDGHLVYHGGAGKCAMFSLLGDNNEVIYSKDDEGEYVSPSRDDWKIIHRLSGQSARRSARVQLASEVGSFAASLASMELGLIQVPNPQEGDEFPLAPGYPGRRPKEWVSHLGGKIVVSNSPKVGYYRLVRKLPKVWVVRLVREW